MEGVQWASRPIIFFSVATASASSSSSAASTWMNDGLGATLGPVVMDDGVHPPRRGLRTMPFGDGGCSLAKPVQKKYINMVLWCRVPPPSPSTTNTQKKHASKVRTAREGRRGREGWGSGRLPNPTGVSLSSHNTHTYMVPRAGHPSSVDRWKRFWKAPLNAFCGPYCTVNTVRLMSHQQPRRWAA